ncbi:LPP leucine zipper domain-containing protein [Thalassotalea marina]|uniref:Major outer membrane lipoprotein Lpp n=1 Tax=Thalassotalea marina TaxID=1673741 RepID=A0A919EIS6_9GAMM|nr:YbgF trimerization domain-containing protein [Thalassotalea marina]GHF85159.1 hypothetical protein GCM10017161_10850 [Thalassotalea marina]
MKHVAIIAAITGLALTGCANNNGVEQQVSSLSNKVDKLTMEVSKLKAEQEKQKNALNALKQAQKETNQKLDNISSSFKK